MSDPASYLADTELALISSPVIAEYQIVRSWANIDDGYIRVRGALTNGDFIELAEYFVLNGDQIVTVDYRHHWTSGDKSVLRRRWDSTPDHRKLENFPHHIHVGGEGNVVPGQPQSVIDVLRIIEDEISRL
ncbi:MAG: hypothetical protein HY782_16990 [Chloroflexi bacterium]|nr:hypothetical protein [Chloroflexota bacterium]